MQVVQGEAIEGCYEIAPDGYVDLQYETAARTGAVMAGQDAGVHTVRNPSENGELLITVHAYAPPLQDFRRFTLRPASVGGAALPHHYRLPTIAVIGGGFSGSMTAAQILRRAAEAATAVCVVLIERRGAVGEGLAYGTRETCHLLNVPAGKMSAWPDRPDDFVHWAAERRRAIEPTEFLPRQWFGEYVRDTLLAAAHDARATAEFTVVLDEVRRVARHPAGGWMIHLGREASLCADAVVLAVGHRPPSDPAGLHWSGPRTALYRRSLAPVRRQPCRTGRSGADPGQRLDSGGHRAVPCCASCAVHRSRCCPATACCRKCTRRARWCRSR